MEAALTFGSLGDIIAVCQIAIQLGRALGVGCASASGSAREYQDLRKDIDTFVQVLMHVVATYEQYEFSPSLGSLAHVTRSVVDDCGALIKETLDRIVPRYDATLQARGSRNRLRNVYKKVEWLARDKDRLLELQNKLRKNTERLSVLVTLATRHSHRADNATVLSRIEEVRQLLNHQQQDYNALLSHLETHETTTKETSQQIVKCLKRLDIQKRSQETLLTTVKQAFSAIIQVKDILVNVAENVVQVQVMVSNIACMYTLDPTKGLPVTLEDALGFQVPLPMEFFDNDLNWENFNLLLERRFEKRRGYEKVLRREFAIEENCTGKNIDRSVPLTACIRRGMKINMSMIFTNANLVQGSCPRCGNATDAPEDTTIQCGNENCGMWFRMLKLTVEDMDDRPVENDVSKLEASPPPLAISKPPNGKACTKISSIPAEPSDFQRVRLLSILPPSQSLGSDGRLPSPGNTPIEDVSNADEATDTGSSSSGSTVAAETLQESIRPDRSLPEINHARIKAQIEQYINQREIDFTGIRALIDEFVDKKQPTTTNNTMASPEPKIHRSLSKKEKDTQKQKERLSKRFERGEEQSGRDSSGDPRHPISNKPLRQPRKSYVEPWGRPAPPPPSRIGHRAHKPLNWNSSLLPPGSRTGPMNSQVPRTEDVPVMEETSESIPIWDYYEYEADNYHAYPLPVEPRRRR